MKKICFFAQKGGVGRTSSSVNTAGILSQEHDKKVLIIDLDPQGNSSKVFFNELGDKTTLDIFKEKDSLSEEKELSSLIQKTKYKNLDIIVADPNLYSLDLLLNDRFSRELILKRKIEKSNLDYDFIIYDCSPSVNLGTVNALCASDYCIIPSQAELFSIQSYIQITETLDLIRDNLNPSIETLGLLITMFDSRLNVHNMVIEKLKNEQVPLFNSKIPRSVKISESFLYNKIITDYKKNSKGAVAYREFVKELLEKLS